MKKLNQIVLCFVLCFFVFGCANLGVEISDRSVYAKRFVFSQKMADVQGYIKVSCSRASINPNVPEKDQEINFTPAEREGVGFWVGPDLFMTAAHVGVFADEEMVLFFGMPMPVYFKIKDTKYVIDGMDAELLEANRDAALYRVKDANKPYFKFAKELKMGQEVINVGNAFLQGKGIHYGTISVPEMKANMNLDIGSQYGIEYGDDTGFFQAIMTVTFGCSGSPAFVSENGEIKYAGMINFTVEATITIGHNARFLQEMLDRHK